MVNQKKQYIKPTVKDLGSIEDVTGWVGGGCGEFFGGTNRQNICLPIRTSGPADFGS